MPASTAFQTAYLDNLLVGNPERFYVAGALYGLVAKLREGYSAANAQAYVASVPRYVKYLSDAQTASGQATLVADFQAITTI